MTIVPQIAVLLATPLALGFLNAPPQGAKQDATPSTQAADLVLRAGVVYLGDGRMRRNVRILVTDGKIVDLVRDQGDMPKAGKVLDYRRETLIPGLVAAHTDLAAVDNTKNMTPEFVAADNYDFFSKHPKLVASGLTTVYLSPGVGRLMPGRGSVVKLVGAAGDRLVRAESAMRVQISARSRRSVPAVFTPPLSPTSDDPLLPPQRQLGSSRPSQLAVLAAAFAAAGKPATNGHTNGNGTNIGGIDYDLSSLRDVVAGSIPVRLSADTAADIVNGLDFFERRGIKVILERPTQVIAVAQRLAAESIPVIVPMPLRPSAVMPGDRQPDDAPPRAVVEAAGALANAGVSVSIVPSSDQDLDKLRTLAGLAARYGLPEQKALAAITLEPAKELGVANRVGSIEAGKDADFVVLTGKPFDARSQVAAVLVGGKIVHERKSPRQVFALRAGRVLLGDGNELRDAYVIVQGGKITDVGKNVPVPPGAKVLHFPDGVLSPGFIAAATKLGLHSDSGSSRISAATTVDVAGALEADDPVFRESLEAGITSAFVTPDSAGSPGARIAAVKTDGDESDFITRSVTGIAFTMTRGGSAGKAQMLAAIKKARDYLFPKKKEEKKPEVKKPEPKPKVVDPITGLWDVSVSVNGQTQTLKAKMTLEGKKVTAKLAISLGPINANLDLTGTFENNTLKLAGQSPMGPIEITATLAGGTLTGTVSIGSRGQPFTAVRTSSEGAKTVTPTLVVKKKNAKNQALEPFRSILAGEAPLVVRVANRDAAEAAIAAATEAKIKINLSGAAVEIAKKPLDLPKNQRIGFLLSVNEIGYEKEGKWYDVATTLSEQGFEVVLVARAQAGTRYLPVHAAWAVSKGLDPRRALQAMTGSAAKSFGLDNRVGRLARGCDADILLLNGDPFELPTRVLGVWVDGKLVVDKIPAGLARVSETEGTGTDQNTKENR